jgi:hypothetical protein
VENLLEGQEESITEMNFMERDFELDSGLLWIGEKDGFSYYYY